MRERIFRVALFLLAIGVFTAPARAVTYTATLLHPAGFTESYAMGVTGASQVGLGYGPATVGNYHGLLWNGTAAGVVDLNPAGFDSSLAYGVSGASQVGEGNGPATSGKSHAVLWSSTAASAVDLHPAGFDN